MKLSKFLARKIVFPLVVNSGIENLMRSTISNSTLNVIYHGVVSKDSTFFTPRHISKEQFEKHLKYFKKHFDVISINEAFERYRNGIKNNRKTITISFDDGYKNNLDIALPLIEKYNLKTTFFVSSIVAEKGEDNFLYSTIVEAFNYFYKDVVIEVDDVSFINGMVLNSQVAIVDFLKHRSLLERNKIMDDLKTTYDIVAKINKIDNEIWKLLNIEEFKQLASSKLVDIGSHGHSHFNLGLISIVDAEEEMRKSKSLIENSIEKSIDMIGYPDGCYNKQIKDLAEKIGYDKQLAAGYKCDDDANDYRILERYVASSTTTFESNVFFISRAFRTKGFN